MRILTIGAALAALSGPAFAQERSLRDVRLFRIYEGTSHIQQLVIARETMKRRG